MKLIDILVQELPKSGGWPEGAECIKQGDLSGEIFIDERVFGRVIFTASVIASDVYEGKVTRKQYEAALAASKVPVWSGEGLPSVGCVIQVATPIYNHGDKARVICHDEGAAICRYVDGDRLGSLCQLEAHECTPIRTEAERKREAVTQALSKVLLSAYSDDSDDSSTENHIYNAISAGKIPGVKLED